MVMVHKTQLGDAPHPGRPSVDSVKHAGCCGAAVLRVHGEYQDTGEALGLQGLHLRGDAGVGIAHRQSDMDFVALRVERALQHLRLVLAPHL